jgi:hypothetical protein
MPRSGVLGAEPRRGGDFPPLILITDGVVLNSMKIKKRFIKIGGSIITMFSIVTMLSQCAAAHATACAEDPEFDEAEWNARVKAADSSLLYAPHVNEKGNFFNPWMERVVPSPFSAALNRIFGEKTRFDNFPEEQYGWRENDYAYLQDKDFNSISFAGHASMIIKIDGETVFTDPFFSNAAFLAGKDVKIKFDYSKAPRRPVVLISHNHYDHLDTKTIKELIKKEIT